MVVRELFAKLGFSFDDSAIRKFDRIVAKAKRKLSELGDKTASIGEKIKAAFTPKKIAGGILSLGAAALSFAAAQNRAFAALEKTSKEMGVTAARLYKLRLVMKRSGVDARDLDSALKRLATGGSAKARKQMAELGIPLEEISHLSADEIFLRVGDALSRIEDPVKRAAVAQQVLGKSGREMAAAFSDGADSVRKQLAEVKQTDESINKLAGNAARVSEKQRAAITSMREAAKGLATTLAIALQPAFDAIVTATGNWVAFLLEGESLSAKTVAGSGALVAALASITAAYTGLYAVVAPLAVAAATLLSTFVAIDQVGKAMDGKETLGGNAIDRITRYLNEEGGFNFPGTWGTNDPGLPPSNAAVTMPPALIARPSVTNHNKFYINGEAPRRIAEEVWHSLENERNREVASATGQP